MYNMSGIGITYLLVVNVHCCVLIFISGCVKCISSADYRVCVRLCTIENIHMREA